MNRTIQHARRLLAAILLAIAALTDARAEQQLYIVTTDATEPQAVSLADIRKMTFDDGQLVVTLTDREPLTLPLATLQKLNFTTADITAIRAQQSPNAKALRLTIHDGRLHASGWDASRRAALTVYSTDGRRLLTVAGWQGEDIDLSQLPRAVYIIGIDSQTAKIAR